MFRPPPALECRRKFTLLYSGWNLCLGGVRELVSCYMHISNVEYLFILFMCALHMINMQTGHEIGKIYGLYFC
jgi:hypothetical protein